MCRFRLPKYPFGIVKIPISKFQSTHLAYPKYLFSTPKVPIWQCQSTHLAIKKMGTLAIRRRQDVFPFPISHFSGCRFFVIYYLHNPLAELFINTRFTVMAAPIQLLNSIQLPAPGTCETSVIFPRNNFSVSHKTANFAPAMVRSAKR